MRTPSFPPFLCFWQKWSLLGSCLLAGTRTVPFIFLSLYPSWSNSIILTDVWNSQFAIHCKISFFDLLCCISLLTIGIPFWSVLCLHPLICSWSFCPHSLILFVPIPVMWWQMTTLYSTKSKHSFCKIFNSALINLQKITGNYRTPEAHFLSLNI